MSDTITPITEINLAETWTTESGQHRGTLHDVQQSLFNFLDYQGARKGEVAQVRHRLAKGQIDGLSYYVLDADDCGCIIGWFCFQRGDKDPILEAGDALVPFEAYIIDNEVGQTSANNHRLAVIDFMLVTYQAERFSKKGA